MEILQCKKEEGMRQIKWVEITMGQNIQENFHKTIKFDGNLHRNNKNGLKLPRDNRIGGNCHETNKIGWNYHGAIKQKNCHGKN